MVLPPKAILRPVPASAILMLSQSISPTLVIFPSDMSREPQAILLPPLSMFPNPEVIEPESKAPVVTILELPAIAE